MTEPVRMQLDSGDAPFTRDAPERPALANRNGAPVVIKKSAPFEVRLSQFLWIVSFAVGGFAVVYLFVIRQDLLPLIADLVETVDKGRSEDTYESAADILFWTVFAVSLAMLLAQITLLVSFLNRKPQVRWWQLATLAVQATLVLLSPEWVALGEKGSWVQPLLAAQAALVLLALLLSILPRALAWSARRVDVRRGPEAPRGADL